jgi:hypothetical protein
MKWVIRSRDLRRPNLGVGEKPFATEDAFIAAAQDLLRDESKEFISATLPNGTEVKGVSALRAIIAASPAAR